MTNVNALINRIKRFQVVSFDVFDTALKRNVFRPDDVFEIIELLYNEKHAVHVDFKRLRKQAAGAAKERKHGEISIDDIYNEISLEEECREELKELEYQTEQELLTVNPDIKQVYDYCIETGKKVYFISDMYLPGAFIKTVLEANGYGQYEGVYVSCEHNKIKRTGELFNLFLEKENIRKTDMIHIGDSRYADWIGPRTAGIKSIHIPRHENKTIYWRTPEENDNIDYKLLYAIINNKESELQTRVQKVGYEVLGPIIVSYCMWLNQRTNGCNGEIWFAARDMHMFVRAYKILFGSEASVPYKYVYLSRRALRPAHVESLNNVAKGGDVLPRGKYTIPEILQYFGYIEKEETLAPEEFSTDEKYDIRSLDQYPQVIEILNRYKDADKEKKESDLSIAYLKQEGLFDKNICFADIGWHGTIQSILRGIAESRKEAAENGIRGYYLGSLDGSTEKMGKENFESFLFDEDSDVLFSRAILVFESLILAPHGSTLGYQNDGDCVVPILDANVKIPDTVLEIQEGAFRFVEDIAKISCCKSVPISADVAKWAFEQMTATPKKEELKSLGEIEYENYYTYKLASPDSYVAYIKKPKKLFNDLKYAPWRVGFLYRFCKLRLPYARIYTSARKVSNKKT